MKQSRIIFFTYLSLLTSLFSYHTHASNFDTLTILTENYPPFNSSKDGIATGTSVDLLINASAAVGDPISREKINVITWARAYRTLLSKPQHMLFSMTRTAERENLFKWAGPITESRTVIFAKKSSKIKPFTSLAEISQSISVVRDTVGDQIVTGGGTQESIMIRNSKPEGAAKMLANERIKLWAYNEISGRQQLKNLGENLEDYRIIHILQTKEAYFAFSKDVDDKLIEKLQKGIDHVRQGNTSRKCIYPTPLDSENTEQDNAATMKDTPVFTALSSLISHSATLPVLVDTSKKDKTTNINNEGDTSRP